MISPHAPQAKRYELQILYPGTAVEIGRVLDKHTNEFLPGPNGTQSMTAQDAHDLHQEYIWS